MRRWSNALRVIAIAIAVLSITARTAVATASAPSTRAIAASSSEWHAITAVPRVLERGADASDTRATFDAYVSLGAASWELPPAIVSRELDWRASVSPVDVPTRSVRFVARGPP